MQQEIIKKCKDYINNDDLKNLDMYYESILSLNSDYKLNFEYIYKNIFLYSCNKENKNILNWLFNIYNKFNDLSKIGLKHTHIYGKFLINKKNIELYEWYENKIIDIIY